MAFEVTNSSRGGRGRGRGFGDRGRGGRGSSRGFRGGDRGGGRGGFRGGERGRGGSFRGNRGFKGGDRNGTNEEAPMLHELAHALQLRVCYKTDIPTDEETSAKFPGFHSRFTKPTDSKAHYLLFKDIESVESAKAKFDKDDTVELVDYVGLKSAKNQPQSLENRQIFLQFSVAKEEEAVKELDSKILSVEFMKEKTRQVGIISSCLVEYSTTEEAQNALKILNANKAEDLKFARASQATKTNNFAKSSIQPNFIVLRDVPKTSTIKEFAPLFPEATALMVFNKTFPGSDFCHVSLRFEDPDRVKEILEDKKEIKILKKKIYIFPAYNCLLAEMPKLGETWTGDLKAAVKSTEESPNKKIKLEDDVSGEEKEAEDEEESEEESDEEEETKEGNDENMDSAEEESAEEEEDSDDD